MYICPHCNNPGLSVLRRSYLGPAVAATCKSCGKKIGIPYGKSSIAAAPFVASLIAEPFIVDWATSACLIAAGAIVMGVLFFKFVPLVKK